MSSRACQVLHICITLLNVASQQLASVVGGNCRRIRTTLGLTQDELASHARAVGLKWNAAKVGNFEAGRWAPTFATVLQVTLALQRATDAAAERGAKPAITDVTLPDLIVGATGWVALSDTFDVVGNALPDICREALTPNLYRHVSARRAFDLTEQRLAKRLGITPAELADVSIRLWDRAFTSERDLRAGPGANRQRKAQVSRQLQAELEKVIRDGND
jgi:transcriptional regulator with XRE-family HTH domain